MRATDPPQRLGPFRLAAVLQAGAKVSMIAARSRPRTATTTGEPNVSPEARCNACDRANAWGERPRATQRVRRRRPARAWSAPSVRPVWRYTRRVRDARATAPVAARKDAARRENAAEPRDEGLVRGAVESGQRITPSSAQPFAGLDRVRPGGARRSCAGSSERRPNVATGEDSAGRCPRGAVVRAGREHPGRVRPSRASQAGRVGGAASRRRAGSRRNGRGPRGRSGARATSIQACRGRSCAGRGRAPAGSGEETPAGVRGAGRSGLARAGRGHRRVRRR